MYQTAQEQRLLALIVQKAAERNDGSCHIEYKPAAEQLELPEPLVESMLINLNAEGRISVDAFTFGMAICVRPVLATGVKSNKSSD